LTIRFNTLKNFYQALNNDNAVAYMYPPIVFSDKKTNQMSLKKKSKLPTKYYAHSNVALQTLYFVLNQGYHVGITAFLRITFY